MMYVPTEVMPASVFAHSRIELHFRHRVPYSSGWIASPAIQEIVSVGTGSRGVPAS